MWTFSKWNLTLDSILIWFTDANRLLNWHRPGCQSIAIFLQTTKLAPGWEPQLEFMFLSFSDIMQMIFLWLGWDCSCRRILSHFAFVFWGLCSKWNRILADNNRLLINQIIFTKKNKKIQTCHLQSKLITLCVPLYLPIRLKCLATLSTVAVCVSFNEWILGPAYYRCSIRLVKDGHHQPISGQFLNKFYDADKTLMRALGLNSLEPNDHLWWLRWWVTA